MTLWVKEYYYISKLKFLAQYSIIIGCPAQSPGAKLKENAENI